MKKQIQKGFTLIELMIVVAIIAILAAIAIPQYQNYVARSQASRGMAELGAMKTAIEACVVDGRTAAVGTGANDCDLGWTHSTLFGAIDHDAQTGVKITVADTGVSAVVGTFGGNASTALKGSTMQWDRTADGVWTCSTKIEEKFRPSGCATTTP